MKIWFNTKNLEIIIALISELCASVEPKTKLGHFGGKGDLLVVLYEMALKSLRYGCYVGRQDCSPTKKKPYRND